MAAEALSSTVMVATTRMLPVLPGETSSEMRSEETPVKPAKRDLKRSTLKSSIVLSIF